jgi:chromosome segregation ATPase
VATSTLISDLEVVEKKNAAYEARLAEQRETVNRIKEQARSTLARIADLSLTSDQLAAKEKLEQSEKNMSDLELQIAPLQENVRSSKGAVDDLRRRIGSMLKKTIADLPDRKGV